MRVAFFALLLMAVALIASDADASYRLTGEQAEKRVMVKAAVAEVMWDLENDPAKESHSKINCSRAASSVKRWCRIRVQNEGSTVCRLRLSVRASWTGKYHKLITKTSRNTCY